MRKQQRSGGGFVCVVLCFLPFNATCSNGLWDSRFFLSGINGTVNAMIVNGPEIYIGGKFTAVGSVPATNIAKWDGTNWSALGSGLGDRVEALAFGS